ncbi:MAG TPA: 30S ribosomal protein S9 [Phycisphaerales bacterium]|nr:30S ribosomal protein S9 [Phycisphaerales bacterium]
MSSLTSNPLGLTLGDAPAPEAPVANPAPVRVAKPADKKGWWWGTGRRKTAVCRVRIRPASGDKATVLVIGKDPKKQKTVDVYFTEIRDRSDAVAALNTAGLLGRFEVVAKCSGGGFMGQAQAMRLAIARALVDFDPNLYQPLRDAGFMTRDAREVERKKYGQAGARRRFQFSKR